MYAKAERVSDCWVRMAGSQQGLRKEICKSEGGVTVSGGERVECLLR